VLVFFLGVGIWMMRHRGREGKTCIHKYINIYIYISRKTEIKTHTHPSNTNKSNKEHKKH
jgi:hypothetical protein